MTDIRILRDVEMPLRDGIRTYAEIWLPDDDRPRPAMLLRTPYEKELAAPLAIADTRMATARGYAVVLQDVRGRGESEGGFEPFVNEESDGVDSVTWVAEQPWCDGNVVMAGASYVGATQWLAAAGAPPALRGIAPTLSSDDYGEGWSYRSGVIEYGFLTSWSAAELGPLAERMQDDPARAWEDLAAAQAIAPWLAEWLANGPASAYWRGRSVAPRRADVQVPAFIVAGWYDIFASASLRSFDRSSDPRDRLVIGPWGHDETLSHLVGEANVGVSGAGQEKLFDWLLSFYDAVLAAREPGLPKVRAYALGARRWVDLDSWPPRTAQTIEAPIDKGTFSVDPAAPVPARGGRGLLLHVPGAGFGVADQRPVLDRDDVHVAARVTLEADTLLAGPVTAHLETTAEGDGERLWAATLCHEQAAGALYNLVEGVAAAAPETRRVNVDLGHTFVWLPAGSALVLLVAGSSFPRWPRPGSAGNQHVRAGSRLALTVASAIASHW